MPTRVYLLWLSTLLEVDRVLLNILFVFSDGVSEEYIPAGLPED
jgi:hypothetical protein